MKSKSAKTTKSEQKLVKTKQTTKTRARKIKVSEAKEKIFFTRPTSAELRKATEKTFKKFHSAIKNLAKR